MARLTKTKLRERLIYNSYELAKLQDEPKVWVQFTTTGEGRMMTVSGWRVHRVGYSTDSDQHESQTFINCNRTDKEEKRLQAIAWASEKYNISPWERSAFGSYHPIGTMDRAKALKVTP